MSDSLQTHEPQHIRPPCPSPTPEFTQTHVHWVGGAIQPFILCCPLLLMPSIFPNIRVFSNESALRIRWPKYWSFNFNINPTNEYSGLISFRIYLLSLAVQGTLIDIDSIFKSKDVILPTKVHIVKAMLFPVVMYGCESWTIKKAEELMLLNCGVGEDSCESLGLQGDPTSPS